MNVPYLKKKQEMFFGYANIPWCKRSENDADWKKKLIEDEMEQKKILDR